MRTHAEDRQTAERLLLYARRWGVDIGETVSTPSSLIGFGLLGQRAVVLKIVRTDGDEWNSGAVLDAFAGTGVVRQIMHDGGAILMDRLEPATPLAALSLAGRDDEATEILAALIRAMSNASVTLESAPTVADCGRSFDRYLDSGEQCISRDLVTHAAHIYRRLCETQHNPILLHGDLQHYNVLFDARCGWTAIDPKGVIGEREYDAGAMLRNPVEAPELYISAITVDRRLSLLAAVPGFDAERARCWAYAQAVLSAIWSFEDGEEIDNNSATLRLARLLATTMSTTDF